jgi:hypothetical protein
MTNLVFDFFPTTAGMSQAGLTVKDEPSTRHKSASSALSNAKSNTFSAPIMIHDTASI